MLVYASGAVRRTDAHMPTKRYGYHAYNTHTHTHTHTHTYKHTHTHGYPVATYHGMYGWHAEFGMPG